MPGYLTQECLIFIGGLKNLTLSGLKKACYHPELIQLFAVKAPACLWPHRFEGVNIQSFFYCSAVLSQEIQRVPSFTIAIRANPRPYFILES